jgi:hypothetical protein
MIPQPVGGRIMGEKSAIEKKQIQEIRDHIKALLARADRLPGSKDEVLGHLEELGKMIRVMPEKESPPEPKDETYIGT